ncbi:MAG: hypothetical protein J5639_09360 [Bacteroidales bacterium]|nr:hypothetical protein [Bacteroidales bacterium]
MNNDLKNILKLCGMAAYVIAVIGGIGYTAMQHHYLIAAAIIVLAVMAWPTFRKLWPEKEVAEK